MGGCEAGEAGTGGGEGAREGGEDKETAGGGGGKKDDADAAGDDDANGLSENARMIIGGELVAFSWGDSPG